jgi:hypothetical protein
MRMKRWVQVSVALLLVLTVGCQSPTDPDDIVQFDDAVDVSVSPDPILADTATGGRTYRVVRGNNQPDDILPYDWHAVFSATLSLNNNATDDDVDVSFPVRITATTVVVKQASGGIVTAPTGGETEKYEFVISGSTGNSLAAVSTPISTTFEVWYDLPSLRREAVVTVSFSFVDEDNATFTKSVDFNVAP